MSSSVIDGENGSGWPWRVMAEAKSYSDKAGMREVAKWTVGVADVA